MRLARPNHRRGERDDGGGGRRVRRAASSSTEREREIAGPVLAELDSRLALPRARRPRLPHARSHDAHAVGRRGAADRARERARRATSPTRSTCSTSRPSASIRATPHRLVEILGELAARGNTLVVVEHEPLLMRAADHLVDLGPGAGEQGGRLLYAGPGGEALEARRFRDRALSARREADRAPAPARAPRASSSAIEGATHHNLKDVDVRFPLGAAHRGHRRLGLGEEQPGRGGALPRRAPRARGSRGGAGGRAPRDPRARALEARGAGGSVADRQDAALVPGHVPGRLHAAARDLRAPAGGAGARPRATARSRSTPPGGRCEACEGAGWVTVEMYFLADLLVPCEACGGARFRREVLEVRYRGRQHPRGARPHRRSGVPPLRAASRASRAALHILRRVGLGYLRLGQPANQLSGGEAQRLKIARELSRARRAARRSTCSTSPRSGSTSPTSSACSRCSTTSSTRGDTVVWSSTTST